VCGCVCVCHWLQVWLACAGRLRCANRRVLVVLGASCARACGSSCGQDKRIVRPMECLCHELVRPARGLDVEPLNHLVLGVVVSFDLDAELVHLLTGRRVRMRALAAPGRNSQCLHATCSQQGELESRNRIHTESGPVGTCAAQDAERRTPRSHPAAVRDHDISDALAMHVHKLVPRQPFVVAPHCVRGGLHGQDGPLSDFVAMHSAGPDPAPHTSPPPHFGQILERRPSLSP